MRIIKRGLGTNRDGAGHCKRRRTHLELGQHGGRVGAGETRVGIGAELQLKERHARHAGQRDGAAPQRPPHEKGQLGAGHVVLPDETTARSPHQQCPGSPRPVLCV